MGHFEVEDGQTVTAVKCCYINRRGYTKIGSAMNIAKTTYRPIHVADKKFIYVI